MSRGIWGLGLALLALIALALPAAASSAQPGCTMVGTPGADELHGGTAADVICGRGGADTLRGGAGADRLYGGGGEDKLYGGPDRDRLFGGRGDDRCPHPGPDLLRSCRRSLTFGPDDCCFVRRPVSCEATTCRSEPILGYPSFRFVAIAPRFVDTSDGDGEVVLAYYLDHVFPVSSVVVDIDGPQGRWLQVRRDGYDGETHIPIAVPASTPPGNYAVRAVTVTESDGRVTAFGPDELDDSGAKFDFEVFDGPDVEAPELNGFSVAPAAVDTDAAPAEVMLSMDVADALSGVEYVSVSVALPGEPYGRQLAGELTAGSIHDGAWKKSVPLSRYAKPGEYPLSIMLTDRIGNDVYYDRAELEALAHPGRFTVSGVGDTTPPEIVGLSMDSRTLHSSTGEDELVFYLHITDDRSGIDPETLFGDLRVELGPCCFGYSAREPELVSGTRLDGVWRVNRIPQVPPGKYTVEYLVVSDQAGNRTVVDREGIEAKGWPASFTNLP